jgi:hypothetical protein
MRIAMIAGSLGEDKSVIAPRDRSWSGHSLKRK